MSDFLNERVEAAVGELDRLGQTDEAEELRSHWTYIREAWWGADRYDSLAAALQAVAENAESAATILMNTIEPTPPPLIG
jgi:hypothetical protein